LAERFIPLLSEGQHLLRFKKNKFSILLSEPDEETALRQAQLCAKKIHHLFSEPLSCHGRLIKMQASIGVSVAPLDKLNIRKTSDNAYIAMKNTAIHDIERTLIYSEDIQSSALSELTLETELTSAIQNSEFELKFQPIVDIKDGHLKGFEALIRWESKVLGNVSPSNFVSIAEEIGLIIPIGEWSFTAACDQLNEWIKEFPQMDHLYVSINVSSVQLAQRNFATFVRNTLEQANLDPKHIKIEITETALVKDLDIVQSVLWELKRMGISLALDDFGTGYSSFNYLNRFPIDTLKVDKGFVTRMDKEDKSRKIVMTITQLATTFELTTIVEGIETAEALEAAKKLGCHSGQGFYFSRPLCSYCSRQYLVKEIESMIAAE
jgi:EAL domain-containing protein (putative c-di-GMP-specific phosphodiesterase class I)